jgi:hypothetical protein
VPTEPCPNFQSTETTKTSQDNFENSRTYAKTKITQIELAASFEQASLVVPEREKETKIGNQDHQLAVPVSASLASKIKFKFSTQTKNHI